MLTLIRADASSAIGLGHLRRCLSLAAALRLAGGTVCFGMCRSDVDAAALVAEAGFEARSFAPVDASAAPDNAADAHAFIALWPGLRPDVVVVDHYRLDARWHASVRATWLCIVAAVDDLADRPLDVNALIDHNPVPAPGHRARYAGVLAREPDVWLCGPRFALLGSAYAELPDSVPADPVRSIGIFVGGTDPAGLSTTVLRACRGAAGFGGPIEVASTSANPGLAALHEAVAADGAARLSLDQPDLAGFYRRHDLQVGAAGGATWERCAAGAPALTLCVADNQRVVIAGLQGMGAIETPADNSEAAIGLALHGLLRDALRRQRLAELGRALVDGRGAQRVALALGVLAAAPLRLQPVTLAEAQRLWVWRNHPSTRAVSRHGAEIARPEHQAWLARTLAAGRSRLWMAWHGELPVGVLRFDPLDSSGHEVSLYLDPGLHGLGLGRQLLAAGEQALIAEVGRTTVHAEVLYDNAASQRLFASSGYSAQSPVSFIKTVAGLDPDAPASQERPLP